MADTGAAVNLIKYKCTIGLPVRNTSAQLTGINNIPVNCQQECKINVEGVDHIFLVVPNNFPLEEDGIAGRPFLEKEDAIILTKQRKIIFNRQLPEKEKILKFDYQYSTDRSNCLKSKTRIEHILDLKAKSELWDIIDSFQDVYDLPGDPLPCTDRVEHSIETIDEIPINVKQYRYPPRQNEEIRRQVKEMKEKGIIQDSNSPYNSPIWVVPKKHDASGKQKWRVVVDYRKLNDKTRSDAYPLPNISEILDQLGNARYFSAFDLASGFHQVPMKKEDRHKTAFSTQQGHFEFVRMPFGLKNSPSTFQRMMDNALRDLIGEVCFVYLDDVVVYGKTLTEHNKNLHRFLQRIRETRLKLQPDKCEYLKPELQYLGHIITEDGVKPNPEKCKSVKEFPRPKNAKSIKQFLGLSGYYRKFIKDYSKKSKPLTQLLKKDEIWKWGPEQEKAFVTLKEELCKEPILAFPDFSKQFMLTTDASGFAIGGILSQERNKKEHPVAYASRTLNKAEQNYSTIEKELLAIVWCVKHYHQYLYGRKFKIITDHRPLVWLMNLKDPHSRLARWRIMLEDYDYEIVYKKGALNTNADALSRNPVLVYRRKKKTEAISKKRQVEKDEPEKRKRGRPRKRKLSEDEEIGHSKKRKMLKETIAEQEEPETLTGKRRKLSKTQTEHEKEELNDESMIHNKKQKRNLTNRKQNEERRLEEKEKEDIEEPEKPELATKARLGKQIILTNDPIPEGSVDVSFIRGENSESIEVYSEEDSQEYHMIIRIDLEENIEELIGKIKEIKEIAINEELEELHIDHDGCVQLSGFPSKTLEKIWIKEFRNSRIAIFLHDKRRTIPTDEEIPRILEENHDSLIGGHGGIKKTYYRIAENYFWESLRKDVENYVKNCVTCQRNKVSRNPTKMPLVITDTPNKFNTKIAMDICGPLPLTARNNRYVLTLQDQLTKYFVAVPLRNFTAATVINEFLKHWVSYFGVPQNILTDKGTNFTSDLMKNFEKMLGIKQITTTSFHPQSNGSLERSHQVLKDFLRHFCNENANNWDEVIHFATLYYNTSKHEGTNFSPCELVFGENARDVSSVKKRHNISYTEYLDELKSKLSKNLDECRRIISESKQRVKDRYDRMINPKEFKPGDMIWLKKNSNANNKTHALNLPWEGPYRVTDKTSEVNYEIEKNNKKIIVHGDRLKYANINMFQNIPD